MILVVNIPTFYEVEELPSDYKFGFNHKKKKTC